MFAEHTFNDSKRSLHLMDMQALEYRVKNAEYKPEKPEKQRQTDRAILFNMHMLLLCAYCMYWGRYVHGGWVGVMYMCMCGMYMVFM